MARLGIIGCGGHGLDHIRYGQAVGFELTAVCDPILKNAKIAGDLGTNVQLFNTARGLMHSGLVDAIVITSLDEYHPEQLAMAVELGLPVLVDKPLAIDEQGLLIVRNALVRAAANDCIVTSCHPRRFDPPYMWVADNMERLQLRLGPLVQIALDFSYHVPSASWKHDRSLCKDHCPHEVDFVRMVLGDCRLNLWPIADSFDNYCVVGTANDTVGLVFTGTRKLQEHHFIEEIRLRFAQGTCVVNTKTGWATIDDHEASDKNGKRKDYQPTTEFVGDTDYDLRLRGVMKDFLDMINGVAGTLSHSDLLVNTQSAIVLAHGDRFTG